MYVLFINRFKSLGFNLLIKLPWQLRCPQTEQKSQESLIFSSRAYALLYRGSRLRRWRHAWVFSCSNFARSLSQQLPAPYKRLHSIDGLKQTAQRQNDWTAEKLTNNKRLFNEGLNGVVAFTVIG